MRKRLKSHVLARSEEIFGQGWRPFAAEYLFPETGDRADVILQGPGDKWLAVEMETKARNLAGLLRALKFQAMLPAKEPLPPTRIRGAVVAQRYAPEVIQACRAHDVLPVRMGLR